MARIPVFYSFHYNNDVFRVQQIRNMGVIDGEEPVSKNDWEQIKRRGDAAVERWIDENMKYRRCVVVLIGQETASRKWVRYEIAKAWDEGRGLFGIYIHNLNCMVNGTCPKGPNPFDSVLAGGVPLSSYISTYDPWFPTTYSAINSDMAGWVNDAVEAAKRRFV